MSQDTPPSSSKRIVVLGTGGTIAGSGVVKGANLEYIAGTVAVHELLGGIETPEGIELEAEQISQLDSKDMSFAVWHHLAKRSSELLEDPGVKGVVITHGTDTIEETAFFLQSVLELSGKPVVLTCAMRPASARTSDGPQNLSDSIAVANSPLQGVFVVCAGEIHGATAVRKAHPYRLNAFDSGDVGPLGVVEEAQIRLFGPVPLQAQSMPSLLSVLTVDTKAWPKVEIVTSHAAASTRLVDLLIDERSRNPSHGVDGIVVAATGNGSIHEDLEAATLRAEAAGIAVRRASRCLDGCIVPTPTAKIESAGNLSPVKARIALLLELLSQRSAN